VTKVDVTQPRLGGKRVAHAAAQIGAARACQFLRKNVGGTRDRAVEARKERTQRIERFTHGVTANARVGIGGIDGVRECVRMTGVPQFRFAELQEWAGKIDAGFQFATCPHAGEPVGTRAAKEREQDGFALIFTVMRGRDRIRPFFARDLRERRIACITQ
jgi:hypothetical protein